MTERLLQLVEELGQPRLLVLGDLILDRYVWGDAERVSQEAPVVLLRESRREIRLGGAANVAHMLRELRADVAMAGVVGDDSDGQCVRETLASLGVDTRWVVTDESRPTTVKERFLGGANGRPPHQMLRVDRECRDALSVDVARRFAEQLADDVSNFDAVLVSDYAKGVCTPELVQAVIVAARRHGIPVLVDPAQVDYDRYRGATAMTPNRWETQQATGITIENSSDAMRASHQLLTDYDLDVAFVTLDSDGMVVAARTGLTEWVPTRRREVYDITGAGDMVLAMIGTAYPSDATPVELARLANVAGGLEVEHVGVVPIRREDVLHDLQATNHTSSAKVCDLATLQRHVHAHRRQGERVVLTNGCFDLIHVGHVSTLEEAASHGERLIVAVNSDASVRGLDKASDRPIVGQADRARMLAALSCVDYVIVFDELTPHRLLDVIQPDVLVKGGTYSTDEIVGREIVEGYGGRVAAVGCVDGVSTTNIVQSIRGPFPTSSSPEGRERRAG